MVALEVRPIRYYVKINAKGEESYFGGRGGHFGSAEAIGRVLIHDVRRRPDAPLVNGPEPGWDEKCHSDGFGEYQLRELTIQEERQLLDALYTRMKKEGEDELLDALQTRGREKVP